MQAPAPSRPAAEEQSDVVAVSSHKLSNQITIKRRTLNRAMHRNDNMNEQHSAGNTIANDAAKENVSQTRKKRILKITGLPDSRKSGGDGIGDKFGKQILSMS